MAENFSKSGECAIYRYCRYRKKLPGICPRHQVCLRGTVPLYGNTICLLTQLKMAKAAGSSLKEPMKTENRILFNRQRLWHATLWLGKLRSVTGDYWRQAREAVHHHYFTTTGKTVVRCNQREIHGEVHDGLHRIKHPNNRTWKQVPEMKEDKKQEETID